MDITKLHQAVAKICPGIVSVRESGVFDYSETCTEAEESAAQAIFANWSDPVETKEILRSTIIERLEAINKFDDAITIMEQPENLRAKYKWFSMVAIRIDDSDVRSVLNAISVNPDTMLY